MHSAEAQNGECLAGPAVGSFFHDGIILNVQRWKKNWRKDDKYMSFQEPGGKARLAKA
jgi:hypothetical protein